MLDLTCLERIFIHMLDIAVTFQNLFCRRQDLYTYENGEWIAFSTSGSHV